MAQTAPSGRNEPITLNFVNADIEAVARTMATVTGLGVVVDPRVKGTISLVTEKPVSRAAAMNQFLAALRLQGYTMVETGGIYKVLPEADAKLQSASVGVSTGGAPVRATSNQIITQIIKLNYENANNLVQGVKGWTDASLGPHHRLFHGHWARPGATLPRSGLERGGHGPEPRCPGGAAAGGQADASYKTTLVAEPRGNSLILRAANPARVNLVKSLIEKLDQPASQSANGAAGNIYVVYLKNADATKLAATLRAAMAGETRVTLTPAATAGAAGAAAATAGQATTGGQIQADASTNSLIITAAEPQYRQLRAVIDKLDSRRAQVFVESLIAEVSADRAAEFGIQWQGALGNAGSRNIGLLGTNFGSSISNIINLSTSAAAGTPSVARGANFGVAHQTNGVYVLGFLARFLEETGSGNVLSTPNLLTLDNEEAKIVIGQNVPFVTGQFTNTGSSANTVNPFQTIERKDVGLTLKVKPQISENGTVKMSIYQEISSVQASTANASNGPTTNKRTIESNVLVEDGAIVVLGGLLQDEYTGNQEKVPGLGDVPFFGNLFKSETRTRKKTNLMVFLRPVVVRDAAALEEFSMDRYDLMRAGQKAAQPVSSVLVPVNEGPLMPPKAPRAAAPASAASAPKVTP